MHLNPIQFVAGMMAGLFLGCAYWKTISLLACMTIHATNNAVFFFTALYDEKPFIRVAILTKGCKKLIILQIA
jgi:membrane protease YdiL (CAAX protease family)